MTPPKFELFIGLPIRSQLQAVIDSYPASKRDLYIGASEGRLNDIVFENKRYIGKYCGPKVDLEQMLQIEANILSFLGKLAPDVNWPPLTLFPVTPP